MFKHKKFNCAVVNKDGVVMIMDKETYKYLQGLEREKEDLEKKSCKLQNELDTIKPVLEDGNLKPAVSKSCRGCRFVVRSRWNGDILGCCKDNLCDDYQPEEG
jgi:hypothetical protein